VSVLTLIRHGQSTPFEKDTDRLSPLGELQARHLGEFWSRRGVACDEVFCGSLVRQKRTAEIVGRCCSEAGLPWPAVEVNAGLNEYDGLGITATLVPLLAAQDPAFAGLLKAAREAAGRPDRNRHFQRMFEVVAAHWVAGSLASPQVESFQAFHGRVSRAMDGITGRPGSRRVAVFTSGGPIGATVQRVVKAPPATGIDINWRVRNCSITEFLYSSDRITLDLFNSVPHLEDPSLLSFR
jgi:broad specificity phosphatase PhoE